MKLKDSTAEVEISPQGEEIDLHINTDRDTGLFFELVVSKIYSNPIGSVCREIASNSRDSHREAGVSDVPIEIIIPDDIISVFNPNEAKIIFRDRGVGLSPERVRKIFASLGTSTKRTDNTQTGGYGYGSKTPFSYTNRFQVKTVYNKKEYIYIQHFLREGLIPAGKLFY